MFFLHIAVTVYRTLAFCSLNIPFIDLSHCRFMMTTQEAIIVYRSLGDKRRWNQWSCDEPVTTPVPHKSWVWLGVGNAVMTSHVTWTGARDDDGRMPCSIRRRRRLGALSRGRTEHWKQRRPSDDDQPRTLCSISHNARTCLIVPIGRRTCLARPSVRLYVCRA